MTNIQIGSKVTAWDFTGTSGGWLYDLVEETGNSFIVRRIRPNYQGKPIISFVEEDGDENYNHNKWFLADRFKIVGSERMPEPDISLDDIHQAQEVFEHLQAAKG